jgi:hypothetical protein
VRIIVRILICAGFNRDDKESESVKEVEESDEDEMIEISLTPIIEALKNGFNVILRIVMRRSSSKSD